MRRGRRGGLRRRGGHHQDGVSRGGLHAKDAGDRNFRHLRALQGGVTANRLCSAKPANPYVAGGIASAAFARYDTFLLRPEISINVHLSIVPSRHPAARSDRRGDRGGAVPVLGLSLIHISEPTRRTPISYAV